MSVLALKYRDSGYLHFRYLQLTENALVVHTGDPCREENSGSPEAIELCQHTPCPAQVPKE